MSRNLSEIRKNPPDADIFHKKNSLSISLLILQKLLTFIKAYNRQKQSTGIVVDISLSTQQRREEMKKAKKQTKPVSKKVAAPAKRPAVPKKKAVVPVKKAKAKTVKAVNKKAVKVVKASKPKAAAKKPAVQGTVLSSVLSAVKKSKNGVAIAKIKEKTGLSPRQLSNALYKLSKSGKIASKERGVYVAK